MPIFGVVPVLVGPLQALLAILPAVLVALGGVVLAALKPSAIKKLAMLAWSQKLVILPIAAVIIAAVHFWPTVFQASGGAEWQLGHSDWPMWRGSPSRRAVAAGRDQEPRSGKVQWSFSMGSLKSFYSSPAVVGNRVYAIGSNYVPPISDSGAIYCLDADSGEVIWQFQADRYRASFSSPSIAGKYLVVGEGLHWTQDSRIFCIDLERSAKAGRGVKAWSFRTGSHVESSPCIYDGKVYVGAGDDGFYCLQLAGDGQGNAVVVWHVEGEDYPDCEPSPAVRDGKVYFGLGKGGKAVVCLDAATGKQLWRRAAPYPVFASPAVADGKVVVGMGAGNYVNSAEEIAANVRRDLLRQGKTPEQAAEATADITPAGRVWCLDANTGKIIWSFEDIDRTVLGSPAIADGMVYVGSRDKYLYCLSLANGELIGKFNARGPIVSGPAVGEEHVFVVTQPGMLFSVDRRTLSADWAVSLNADTMSSPAVAGGHVYVGTNNALLCVGTSQAVEQRPIWAGPGGGPGQSGWTDGSAIPDKASLGWSFAPRIGRTKATIQSPPAYLDGVIYAGAAAEGKFALAAMAIERNASELSAPKVKWLAPADNSITISPAATDEAVLFVDGQAGDTGRALRCLDPDTGETVWRRPVSAEASGRFLITFDKVFIADKTDGMSCLDLSGGNELWSNRLGPVVGLPCLDGDLLFVLQGSPAKLVAIDAPTGEVLWSGRVADSPSAGPVFLAGRLWLGAESGADSYSPISGERTGGFQSAEGINGLIRSGSNVALITDGGNAIVTAIAESGALTEPGVRVDSVRTAVLAGGVLLYCDGTSIRRVDVATGRASLVRKGYPKYEGKIVTPMIVVNSHILYATDKKGLVCLKPKRT